jgi:hypothetical protein
MNNMYCIKHIISIVGVITLYCKAQYVLYQHFDIKKVVCILYIQ